MHVVDLTKADGRSLSLYGANEVSVDGDAPSPFREPLHANPHLRWNPLRGEWVTYAAYRQDRTFLPPPDFNPLAPTTDASAPTEVPGGAWDIAVFENRFPALSVAASQPPQSIVQTRAATGRCEVVVFTQDPSRSLGVLPIETIALLFEVFADRTRRLATGQGVRYVMPFENRGVEMGVTLHHPHGQIYGYPLIPPVPARMQQQFSEYHGACGRSLLGDLIERELDDGARILHATRGAVAFVPACARYPYEVWVAPVERVSHFHDLDEGLRLELARALKVVLLKYDALWDRPMPYLMTWYQAPLDGSAHPEWHLHAEFHPPYRTRDRLKYLAGTELGAGLFAMDALPEDTARRLQQVAVSLDDDA